MDQRDQIPHACFRYSPGPTVDGERELLQAVYNYLSEPFEFVSMGAKKLFKRSITVKVHDDSFVILLSQNRFQRGEWVLLIGPLDMPLFSKTLASTESQTWMDNLKLVCKYVHDFLQGIPTSDIRWYFERGRTQSQAVTSPDKLPWATTR